MYIVRHIIAKATEGASVTAFDFLKDDEATKCKQHIQELISGANAEIVTPTNPLFSRFNEDHE